MLFIFRHHKKVARVIVVVFLVASVPATYSVNQIHQVDFTGSSYFASHGPGIGTVLDISPVYVSAFNLSLAASYNWSTQPAIITSVRSWDNLLNNTKIVVSGYDDRGFLTYTYGVDFLTVALASYQYNHVYDNVGLEILVRS